MIDHYKQIPYHAIELLPCNFCGSIPTMWQYTADNEVVHFAVMCSLTEDESPTGDDCPLVMPPETFYAPRKSEAAKYWNEWAKFGRSRMTAETSAQKDAKP